MGGTIISHHRSDINYSERSVYSPDQLARMRGYKSIVVQGKREWHGANPTGSGATDDGYILNEDGTSYDRKSGEKYNSKMTAEIHGIEPMDYEPYAAYKQRLPKPSIKPSLAKKPSATARTIKEETIYNYVKDGEIAYQVVRIDHADGTKTIYQRQSETVKNMNGVERTLYNHDDVIKAKELFVVEGEKCANAANHLLKEAALYGEYVATCAPGGTGGAKLWKEPGILESITGKNLAVFPDNDAPGRKLAETIKAECTGKAFQIGMVELPDLPAKGDVVDFLDNGGTLETILQISREALNQESPEKKTRFTLISTAELIRRPDPTWLIHKILQSHTNSCLSAAHASFKSFLALDMACCVATGRRWCGRDVMQGVVVYVCAEGASGMKSRLMAWCADKGVNLPTDLYFIDDAVQAHEEKDRADLFASLCGLKPALIILDTLSLCALGLEENASKDMNLFMAGVKRIQDETGAHVLLIHHHSKAGGARGSTAIPAAVQSEFELKRERDGATLTCKKQKDAAEFKPMTFESRKVEYGPQGMWNSLVLDYGGNNEDTELLTGNDTRVYELLVETFGANGATSSNWMAIAADENIAKRSFYRAKKNLVEKGKVDDGKGGKGGRGAIYRPTELINHAEAEEVSANVPLALIGTDDTHKNTVGAKVPTPFRVGTNGTNLYESIKNGNKAESEPYGAATKEVVL